MESRYPDRQRGEIMGTITPGRTPDCYIHMMERCTGDGVMRVLPTHTTFGLFVARVLGMALLPRSALGVRSGLPGFHGPPFLPLLVSFPTFFLFGDDRVWEDAEARRQ